MIRLIKEDAITDLHKQLNNFKQWDKKTLLGWLRGKDLNIEDCEAIPIDRPKGYTTAKRSKWPIIAMNADGQFSLFGGDDFKTTRSEYDAGGNKISKMFHDAIQFYQIVPKDESSYVSRTDIRKAGNRGQGTFVDVDKISRRPSGVLSWSYSKEKPFKGSRYMTKDEQKLYNPDVNKNKYLKMLQDAGLDRFIGEYKNICSEISTLNDRIKLIDVSALTDFDSVGPRRLSVARPIELYSEILSKYCDVVNGLLDLHEIIDNLKKYPDYYDYRGRSGEGYKKVRNKLEYIESDLERANKILGDLEAQIS